MIDTTLDGQPLIRCSWPESDVAAENGPVHTLAETADHLAELGYPRLTEQQIANIESSAMRKLACNQALRSLAADNGITRRTISDAALRRRAEFMYRARLAADSPMKMRAMRVGDNTKERQHA